MGLMLQNEIFLSIISKNSWIVKHKTLKKKKKKMVTNTVKQLITIKFIPYKVVSITFD